MPNERADSEFATTIRKGTSTCREILSDDLGGDEVEGPTWDLECLIPAKGRRNEQLFIETRKSLCSLSRFQDAIKVGQKCLSAGSLKEHIAESICETWKITEGKDWVIWLLEHWNPLRSSLPPLSSDAAVKSFPPWMLQLDYLRETTNAPPICRVVTITLHAGISKTDTQRLIQFVFKKLPTAERIGGRPRLSDIERNILQTEFAELGIPKPARRKTMIRKVQKKLVSRGLRRISETAIGNVLRSWLIEQGQTVRRHHHK